MEPAGAAGDDPTPAQLLSPLSITCDTTMLLRVKFEEQSPDILPEILPLNRRDCEAAIVQNGSPNLGKIILSIASSDEEIEKRELSVEERKKVRLAAREAAKNLLRPVLNICLELLHAAHEEPDGMSIRACLFAMPRSSAQTQALSDRLLEIPNEYPVCASEPLLPSIRADHPLKALAGSDPLTWDRFMNILLNDAFVCGKGEQDNETCIRFVPTILTDMPNEDTNQTNASILAMRYISVYHGQWRLAGQNQRACDWGINKKACDIDKPPSGDSGGICVEPEDFHAMLSPSFFLAP
ncbi:MAG: hypothetical protein JNJ53_08570 [Rhizobiales bacterium]|nr:hypothetical protein [Hyphomicrobiales bacterium]